MCCPWTMGGVGLTKPYKRRQEAASGPLQRVSCGVGGVCVVLGGFAAGGCGCGRTDVRVDHGRGVLPINASVR